MFFSIIMGGMLFTVVFGTILAMVSMIFWLMEDAWDINNPLKALAKKLFGTIPKDDEDEDGNG